MTVFRNCFTESFLNYQCEAMGGKMRLMPRGWVFHHNAVDAWTGDGGSYNYLGERHVFDRVIDKLHVARIEGRMSVEFLKDLLYEPSTCGSVLVSRSGDDVIMQG